MYEQLFLVIDSKNSLLIKTEDYTKARDVAASKNGEIIKHKEDLHKLSGTELVKLYNTVSGRNVKKFESKASGVDRFWKFLVPKQSSRLVSSPKVNKSTTKRVMRTKKVKADASVSTDTSTPVSAKASASDKKLSVSGMFRQLIVDGYDKIGTLSKVREAFPDRNIPDSYYNYYVRECANKNLITTPKEA